MVDNNNAAKILVILSLPRGERRCPTTSASTRLANQQSSNSQDFVGTALQIGARTSPLAGLAEGKKLALLGSASLYHRLQVGQSSPPICSLWYNDADPSSPTFFPSASPARGLVLAPIWSAVPTKSCELLLC